MAGLTITFLGTGTSQGIPLIGCDCAVCSSSDPRDKRTRSSIYVQTPESAWVVDTGTDFRSQCLRENVRRLDAVVLTHSHADHIMGFDDLRAFCPNGREIPVYASEPTMRDLERVFVFAFDGKHRFPGYIHPVSRIVSDEPFMLGETVLTPLPVPHGKTTVFGYLFSRAGEKLVAYLSDCHLVPDSIVERISGVRHFIVDALRHKPHPTHLSVSEALAVAARVRAKQTWFTHLCHDLAHAETEAALPPGVAIAFDGLKLET